MGATLAALSGINNISGPGMLDFESCFSLEKLVLDNEICGMTQRLVKGIEPREDFPSQPLFEEFLSEQHLLIADHTRKFLKDEIFFPAPVIDRANRSRWQEEGSLTLRERAHSQVEKGQRDYRSVSLPEGVADELKKLMTAEAGKYGMNTLPELTEND
jgi:trimethylamine--corrinoid protein Co-methyltransferase